MSFSLQVDPFTRCDDRSVWVKPHDSTVTDRRTIARDIWMFDVDGVLVSLLTKRANDILIDTLVHLLCRGDLITFNSGRAPMAVLELVLSRIEQQISNKTLLLNMMVVGEKGGAWAQYAPDYTLQIAFDTDLTVPRILSTEMRRLVLDTTFCDVVEIESGKHTMMSVIKQQNIPLEVFQRVQAEFVPLAQQCLADLNLAPTWKIDAVSDSIEIEQWGASKGKGATRIMRWLHTQGVEPRRVTTFEDSPSGISMAETIFQMKMPVEFVFTGTQPLPERTYGFPIVQTKHKYERGTLEYFARYEQLLFA